MKLNLNKKNIVGVPVEYVESGTFLGGEEDCSIANVDSKTEYVVISKKDYDILCGIVKVIDSL